MKKNFQRWLQHLHPKKAQRKISGKCEFDGDRCVVCGKEIDFEEEYSRDTYSYKITKYDKRRKKYDVKYFCSWKHLREYEKLNDIT